MQKTINKLVYTVTENNIWGVLIEAYLVKLTSKNQFSYDAKKINTKNYEEYLSEIDELNHKIFEILKKYSEDNIIKSFSKNKERPADFFKRIDEKFFKNHIRPYIEKQLVKLIDIFSENNIPLYYKKTDGSLINHEPINIIKEHAKPVFNINKLDNSTQYKLLLKTESKEISLYKKNLLVLSDYPCIILLENNLYKIGDDFDSLKIKPFLNKEHIEIPEKHETAFYKNFVKRIIKKHKVNATGFDIQNTYESPFPYLNLEADLNNKVVLELFFKYNNDCIFSPRDEDLSKVQINSNENHVYNFIKINRNKIKEKEFENYLISLGITKLNQVHFTLPQSNNPLTTKECINQRYLLLDWISEHKEDLLKKGFKFSQEHFPEKYFIGKPEIDINIDNQRDWFDLKGYVIFGDYKVPFIDLKNNILKGEREYLLPDGKVGLIPEEWFERYGDILKFAKKNNESLSLKKHHFKILENIDSNKKGIKENDISPFKKTKIPKSLKANLRPYQITGFQWLNYLQANEFGGCLADDMGLGKTIQALSVLLKLKENGNNSNENNLPSSPNEKNHPLQLDIFDNFNDKEKNNNTSLIVMPLSLIHNWTNEIKQFAPSLNIYKHIGTDRPKTTNIFSKYDIIITTYGMIRSDIDFLKDFNFSYIILDESQIIKNPASKIFLAVKKLKGQYRLVLTGTPIENSLTDLWTQFSFLNPGMLGSLRSFKDEFVTPIEKEKNIKKEKKLKNIIEPFILRRDKNDVAKDLPALTEKINYCEMTEDQKIFYERKKSEVRNMILENYQVIGENKTKFLLLSSLTKLRLIANHPAIVEASYKNDSGKFNEILQKIKDLLIREHKVLIFSQFVKHLNLFAEYFKKSNTDYRMLTGKTKESDRASIIKEFQNNKDIKVFLISMRAGGTGLNLTGADYVFMLDPWWNPAVEAQAINRAHRIGQDKKVFVYKFITTETVEEKIVALQKQKSELSDIFIKQNNPLKSLHIDELLTII